MLSEYFEEIREQAERLTDIDLARIGGQLPKPKAGEKFLGKMPKDLQKLWALVDQKKEEIKKTTLDHHQVCKQDDGPECEAVHKKCFKLTVEAAALDRILSLLLSREIGTDEAEVSVTKNFDIYTATRECGMLDMLGLPGIGVMIKIPRG